MLNELELSDRSVIPLPSFTRLVPCFTQNAGHDCSSWSSCYGPSTILTRTWAKHGTYFIERLGGLKGMMHVRCLEQHLQCGKRSVCCEDGDDEKEKGGEVDNHSTEILGDITGGLHVGVSDWGGAGTSDQHWGSSLCSYRILERPGRGEQDHRRTDGGSSSHHPWPLSCFHQAHNCPHTFLPVISSVSFPP